MNLERDINWYAEGERDNDFLQYLIDELLNAVAELESVKEFQRGTIEAQTNIIKNLYKELDVLEVSTPTPIKEYGDCADCATKDELKEVKGLFERFAHTWRHYVDCPWDTPRCPHPELPDCGACLVLYASVHDEILREGER